MAHVTKAAQNTVQLLLSTKRKLGNLTRTMTISVNHTSMMQHQIPDKVRFTSSISLLRQIGTQVKVDKLP